jgi:UDPglucose--hexose-1-phosphate uridylyltransferase
LDNAKAPLSKPSGFKRSPRFQRSQKRLKTSLKALKELVNDPPYNYGFHLAINQDAKDYYHWHLEVYPKLSIWAGFELNRGIYINTVKPETAAESRRKTIKA